MIVMICRLFRDEKLGERAVETWWEEHTEEQWQTRAMRLKRAKLLCERPVLADPRQRDTVLNVYADRTEWNKLTPHIWTAKRAFIVVKPARDPIRLDASQVHDLNAVLLPPH